MHVYGNINIYNLKQTIMEKRNFLWSVLAYVMAVTFCVGFIGCGGGDDGGSSSDKPTPPTPDETMVDVSPTSVSLLAKEGSSTTISISSTGRWSISECPDWLHITAFSGNGNTNVTLTTKSENFSDQERTASLTITAGTSSTSVSVSQEPILARNLQVGISDMTIMSDGFACNLTFPTNAKGYREAFFTEYAMQTKTERDIYNMLMEKKETSGSADFTYSPIVDPGTSIYYCIAAYGNENNSDGTHKYGAMSMEKITIPAKTLYADMYLTSSYTSTRYTATAQKYGTYGTRCQKYYYFAYEGETAETMWGIFNNFTYAFLALFEYKSQIALDPDHYAVSGQSFQYSRNNNNFFFGTWGVDDKGNFSNEHNATYQSPSSAPSILLQASKKAEDVSKWNKPRIYKTKADIEKLFNIEDKARIECQ